MSLLKTIITFGLGVYTGVYIAQNKDIDKVEDPAKLFRDAVDYVKSTVSSPPPKDK